MTHCQKNIQHFKDMCIPRRTLYVTKQNCDGSYLQKHIPVFQSD